MPWVENDEERGWCRNNSFVVAPERVQTRLDIQPKFCRKVASWRSLKPGLLSSMAFVDQVLYWSCSDLAQLSQLQSCSIFRAYYLLNRSDFFLINKEPNFPQPFLTSSWTLRKGLILLMASPVFLTQETRNTVASPKSHRTRKPPPTSSTGSYNLKQTRVTLCPMPSIIVHSL